MSLSSSVKIHSRILDSAEECFALHGYEAASLRQITRNAGVNLAAAHYHLGNKQTLYALVFSRRLRPLNEARLAELEKAEAATPNRLVPLAQVLEIMARPLFELCHGNHGGRHFIRVLGRSLSEPAPFKDALLAREFQPAMTRLGQALRRHVPALSPEDFLWRLSFVMGAMHHTLATLHQMSELTRGICRNDDHESALRRFLEFATVTFQASPPAE
ncbi:MAG: putative DNA-binding transcriptional regulator [Lacunisphaera sp.]|nr:putative DNA-binding transcriptional regulator [Lacunisphaera sp.]